ncbi:hypothetical protein [Parafrankia sp. EUN1f]|uniref:hypothetical protein n=1 Tax=Parafrankia sp. EUN1f TaxID=102897 RepID=UPI0012F988CB|nr:hypothetical protein [Parafrankia sp. EUN1f]
MALTAETPVISAGPTTGANPLVQADQARDAFGSADTQASRSSRTELPTPQPTATTGPTASDEGSTPAETDYLQVSRYSSQYHATQTPASAQAPSPEQSLAAESESNDLSGYELPFVPLTPQTTAATPTNGTDTSDDETSDPSTPGVPTPTPSASASPDQPEPKPTTKPASTPTAISTTSGSTTTPRSTATTTRRPTTSATSTTPPATTATQTSGEGSLPFNPDPVEVTPIWDVSIPSITVE